MRALIFKEVGEPLQLKEIPPPEAGPNQVLIKVSACALCRTDLHIIDGELPSPKLPLILGHQIVGTIEALGERVTQFKVGDRVGVPWLGGCCHTCSFCKAGSENLCDRAQYTGYTLDGGLAEYTVAHARFVFSLPKKMSDIEVAPLLCGGLIGYRAYRLSGFAKSIGFFGFGSSAHILTQLVNHKGGEVYAFVKPGDTSAQEFAKSLGVAWAGNSTQLPPHPLDAAIIFAPIGELVPQALRSVRKGGIVVCAGIHMSEIPAFSYDLLWEERQIRSVANLTRRDGEEFLTLAAQVPIHTHTKSYPLDLTHQALLDLKQGNINGTAVITL